MEIAHDPRLGRFTAEVPSGTAVLSYAPAEDGVLELYSTYVPPPARGKNVAAQLVQAALAYARDRHLTVRPTCWYVDLWMRRHPEYADLRAR
jgi:predicted GNAT family acetyltransferase